MNDTDTCCYLARTKPALHAFLLGVEDADLKWFETLILQTWGGCCELEGCPDVGVCFSCEVSDTDLSAMATNHNWRNPALVSEVLGWYEETTNLRDNHLQAVSLRARGKALTAC